MEILENERNAIRGKISTLKAALGEDNREDKTSVRLRNLEVELGFSELSNHAVFNSSLFTKRSRVATPPSRPELVAKSDNVFEAMKRRRFENVIVPKLVKAAESSTSTTTQYYTIILSDLDRPNLDSRSFEEWCHWLVTDIPVQGRVTLAGGLSPYLKPAENQTVLNSLRGVDFHPDVPSEAPVIPGNVIYPYVPPHPANSNPRKLHRYVLYAFKQKQEGVTLDLDALAARVKEVYGGVRNLPAHRRSVYGAGEQAMKVRERGLVPAWSFMAANDMTLAGYAFFTSCYNVHTSSIFTRLGIHEPVFGELSHIPTLVNRVSAASSVASKLALKAPLSLLTSQELQPLNTGLLPPEELPRRITKRLLEAQSRANELKSGKSDGTGKTEASKEKRKTPRITTIGATGLVKSKPEDLASKVVGDWTKKVLWKPYRYRNV
ncbi:hypothetical protein HDU96_001577 [Phlyctochytrium bullatum]|nr:hypothetical protein HDU96_001577 [Phlyctochytrium bullatum]